MLYIKRIFAAKLPRLGFLIAMGWALSSQFCLSQSGESAVKPVYLFPAPIDSASLKALADIRAAKAVEISPEGSIFLLDGGANRIYKLDSKLRVIKATAGWGTKLDCLDNPMDIAIDNGLNVFTADYQNRRIVRLDKDLNFLMEVKLNRLHPEYEFPLSLALTGWGDICILEERTGAILQLQSGMNSLLEFGGFRPGKAASPGAARLASDEQSRIYASIPRDSVIIVYDRYGNYLDKLKTAIPAEAISCESGFVWYGGKRGLACMKGKTEQPLQYLPPESRVDSIIDVAVSNGRLAVATKANPVIRLYQLSYSPAHIQW